MPRATRLHRLPQRLDYTLIPAPLDLSLPPSDEKSLPTIIVTPSSPTHEREFFLAWMPPPPPPPSAVRRFFTRVNPVYIFGSKAPQLPPTPTTASMEKKRGGVTLRWRTVVMLMMLFFILIAHVLTHGMAARRPRLFTHHAAPIPTEVIAVPDVHTHAPAVGPSAVTNMKGTFEKWFDLEWFFVGEEVEERDFVVEALGPAARR